MKMVLRLIFCAMLCLVISACAGPVTEKEIKQNVKESTIITEEPTCSVNKPDFLLKDEKSLYREMLKIPYREFEKNMTGYYKLTKINPTNAIYNKKFKHYAQIFYKKRLKYQLENYLTVDSPKGQSTVPLLRRPNTGEFNKIADIPDETFLKIIDYSVVKYTASYEGIWYQVEYCGQQGYISEGWTDSIMNDDIVKLLWR